MSTQFQELPLQIISSFYGSILNHFYQQSCLYTTPNTRKPTKIAQHITMEIGIEQTTEQHLGNALLISMGITRYDDKSGGAGALVVDGFR